MSLPQRWLDGEHHGPVKSAELTKKEQRKLESLTSPRYEEPSATQRVEVEERVKLANLTS